MRRSPLEVARECAELRGQAVKAVEALVELSVSLVEEKEQHCGGSTRHGKLGVSKIGMQPCQGCGLYATLRTLDIATPALRARSKREAAIPAGWAPLIALCGPCWTDVVRMLRENATPDSNGEISP